MLNDRGALTQLSAEGFVVVDALDEGTVSELRSHWFHDFRYRTSWAGSGFYASVNEANGGDGADQFLRQTCNEVVDRLLRDYRSFYAGFLVKGPHARQLDPHLDWSLSDERVRPTFNCWIPLSDVDERNGALAVVPGSHLDVGFERSPTDRHLAWPSSYLEGRDHGFEVIRATQGQAVIYDMRLVHMSTANESQEERIAVAFALAHDLDAERARATFCSYLKQNHEPDRRIPHESGHDTAS